MCAADGGGMHLLRVTAVLLAFGACADESNAPAELGTKREQFSQSLNGSYRFTWRRSCECSQETTTPIRITVQQGNIISAINLETNQPVATETLQGLTTIEGVFDTIEDAYNENAAVISVTYDPTSSFPASVGIDYSLQIADEEFSLQISDVISFDAT
jgi:hypothetical protein